MKMQIEKKLSFSTPLSESPEGRVLIAAALAGGEELLAYFGKLKGVQKKGRIDLLTEADLASEKAVISCLQEHFPDHGIVSEEFGSVRKDSPWQWIIDPLDGTTNFAHGIPFFSVSIALSFQGKLSFACVHNPLTCDWFLAENGKGAYHGSAAIRVSETKILEESLLATGFPYSIREKFESHTKRFEKCLYEARGIRRLGSASLDLCFLAKGSFDGFWEEDLKPWDTAAGVLIAKEAGARITDFNGNPYHIEMPTILATNGHIHNALERLLE